MIRDREYIHPNPFKVYQHPEELRPLVEIYRELHPLKVLEIGSLFGGTLWFWMRHAMPGATVVSVDQLVWPDDYRHDEVIACRKQWPKWARRFGVDLHAITGDSTKPETIDRVADILGGDIDFVFIDGGHDWDTVNADFENYWQLMRPYGVMAFHDISYPDKNYDNIDVGAWWRRMKAAGQYDMADIEKTPNQTDWGIGVIYA